MPRPARDSIETELGIEIRCSRCKQFWPADNEFFYMNGGKPHSSCKACYSIDPKVIARKQQYTENRQKESRA